eukprot:gene26630-32180_t
MSATVARESTTSPPSIRHPNKINEGSLDDFGLPLVPDATVKTESKHKFTIVPLQVIPDHDPEADVHFIPQHHTSSPRSSIVPSKLLRTRSRSPTDFGQRDSPTDILKSRYRSSSLKSIEEGGSN